MKRSIWIALGGILGAVLRWWIKDASVLSGDGIIPVHTVVTNLLACLLIGFVAAFLTARPAFDGDLRLFLVPGFLGALSTFSTVCREVWHLATMGHGAIACLYALGSLLAGLLAVMAGTRIAERLPRTRRSGEAP